MIDFINFAKPETGNFLVDIIFWLVRISTSVTLGVILFTVLLKLITLPFDFFSRASMRKNSLLMEEMRPELEKLQRQYADNKQLYNQKMMALYKKHGYSMFGACLPTILTLVIFIVAINAFTSYSRFQNQQYFYNMGASYDNVIYAGMETDDKYITRDETGKLIIDCEALKEEYDKGTVDYLDNEKYSHEIQVREVTETVVNGEKETKTTWFVVKTTNGYIEHKREILADGSFGKKDDNFAILKEKVIEISQSEAVGVYDSVKNAENNFLRIKRVDVNGEEKQYSYNDEKAQEALYKDKVQALYEAHCAERKAADKEPDSATKFFSDYEKKNPISEFVKDDSEDGYLIAFINDIREEKSAETFRRENEQFLWVKNIWVTDSPTKHPVESSWEAFKSTHGYSGDVELSANSYSKLINKLEFEQGAPNGYFILVILTAGVSLLMQIVMGKSQKAQMELQTVNGQGAQTQKMMKWMMPIMMAVFSFMYTAAFAVYIIISNILSIGTTYGINFLVDRKFKKRASADTSKKVIRGRVYTPKEEPKQEKPVKEKKAKVEEPKGDFLSGTADAKKNVRGRLK